MTEREHIAELKRALVERDEQIRRLVGLAHAAIYAKYGEVDWGVDAHQRWAYSKTASCLTDINHPNPVRPGQPWTGSDVATYLESKG